LTTRHAALILALMKKPLIAFAVALLLMCAGQAAFAQKNGTVTITYTLTRMSKIASDQLAVWIEDGQGKLVKTIFVTNFMAKRKGYISRPQCCPEWVKAADPAAMSAAQIDAISGATQKAGKITLKWDCTDSKGNPVPAGAYLYKVEGNISWEQRVIWTGGIIVGEKGNTSAAAPLFMPDAKKASPTILADVAATYSPAN
jgi:hypothetical protein